MYLRSYNHSLNLRFSLVCILYRLGNRKECVILVRLEIHQGRIFKFEEGRQCRNFPGPQWKNFYNFLMVNVGSRGNPWEPVTFFKVHMIPIFMWVLEGIREPSLLITWKFTNAPVFPHTWGGPTELLKILQALMWSFENPFKHSRQWEHYKNL